MKKAKSSKRSSTTKRTGALKKPATKLRASKKAAPKTVDEYFDRLLAPALGALHQIRAAIRSVVLLEATEIISYNIPAFKHKKVLVWYAAFSNHCSLFPTAAVIDAFKDELKGFIVSKGTVQFPLEKPMPIALIKKLVKSRVAQSESKK